MKTTQHTREPPKPAKQQKRLTLKFNNMKTKHYFTTFLALLFLNTFAQLDKKTWLVGGNASFDSNKYRQTSYYGTSSEPIIQTSYYKYDNFELSSRIGYFVVNKLALGISPEYSYSQSKYLVLGSYNPAGHNSSLSIGPFARYYFLKKDKQFNVLADVIYQMGYIQYSSQESFKNNVSKFSSMVGVEIFFNSSAGVELLAGYNFIKQNKDSNMVINTYEYEKKGFKIAIGFQLHLFKEK